MSTPASKKELGKEYIEPNENAIIAEMVNEVEAQVKDIYKNESMRRQVHTKMHGCVKATFTVEPNLPENCKIGVFKDSKEYQSWIRFSNGNTKPQADGKKDIRGMAIKLMDVQDEVLAGFSNKTSQDFLLMSTEPFFSKNLIEFRGLLKVATAKKKIGLILFALNPFHWSLLKRLKSAMIKCDNPVSIPYWSTQPYRYGATDKAVKYFVKPSATNSITNENTSDPDFLRVNLAQTLNNNSVEYDFLIQFQENADTMPIEDAIVPWSSKFIKVATIKIIKQQSDTPERAKFGENISFNPWHSLPAHMPLGSFNRARKEVYVALSKLRHAQNDIPMMEPQGSPDFLDTEN